MSVMGNKAWAMQQYFCAMAHLQEPAMAHLQGTVHDVGAGSKTEQTATLKFDLREPESLARLCSPMLPETLQSPKLGPS